MKKHIAYILLLTLTLTACRKASLPTAYTTTSQSAAIYPDCENVTVPRNMAPLTFHIDTEADDYVTSLTEQGTQTQIVIAGRDVCPTTKQWGKFQKEITVEIYLQRKGEWQRMKPFVITISPDEIDPYIAYRLIAPSYVTYEGLTICQRNLTTYDERVIYGNMINSNEDDGQCINCHSFQSWNPERMQFHVRQALGGTLIAYDGETEKVDMKTGKTVSAGVYPAWHPTERLIAYSTNQTGQAFHTCSNQKIEVQDTYSDLMLYDLDTHTVLPLESDTLDLDCYPHWSPDGKFLYYCSAHYEQQDTTDGATRNFDMIVNYKDVHYNLYRRAFDIKTKTFGDRQLVFDAETDSMSATLPRVSPDGRWLIFTMGHYGVFHIWHPDADLYIKDLQTGAVRPMDEVNSPDAESYHSWSSNGRWIIFSSRRTDGNFTRPFIAHIDDNGQATKPFELPSKHPEYHRELLRSYNIPEFITGPVTIRPQDLAETIKEPAIKAE